MKNTPSNNISDIKELSLKESLEQYTRYWPLFLIGVALALSGAYLYLRYATPSYDTGSTIIIKDEKKGGGAAELAAFSELSFFSNAFSDKIESELVILSSKSLIAKAVKRLNLNVQYFNKGAIKTSELYDYKPVKVSFLNVPDTMNVSVPIFNITVLTNTSFSLVNEKSSTSNEYTFGDKIDFPFGTLIVVPNLENAEKFKSYQNRPIQIVYRSATSVAAGYKGALKLIHDGKNGEVVRLQMNSPTPSKAEDFLNELVNQYNQDAINDRSEVAQKTSRFIDSRLEIITRELDSVERNKEVFKSTNRLTDIEAEAQMVLQNANEFNKRQVDISTQLELINSMVAYMDNSTSSDLLPANIGAQNTEISSSVATYNQLVLDKSTLLESSTEKNPIVQNINSQLNQLREGIRGSLNNQKRSYEVAIKDLNIQEGRFNSQLSRVPTQEKLFRGILRQQNIKEQLYLFLLQQREETSISLAVTSSKAKVVDRAYTKKSPVSPKRSLIYLLALIAGILVPFLILYVYYLLNTRISSRRDVERIHARTPFIGEVPRLKRGEEELIQHNDRSILAESFRIVRTNLQYILGARLQKSESAKNIFVTSTIKGEGKTFVAFNLALTLAQTGKKVVLVGADIRNPQLHRYLSGDVKSKKGVTEFIVDDSIKAAEIVEKSEYSDNLSIVLSGVIPPNPAELLMQSRTELLFDELKELFDYVIVDTAPSMLVTDTILINKLADVTVYVVRANYTDKKLLEFPLDAINDGRLANVALVLNSVTLNNFGYGNKYGYTYTAEKKSFLQRLFNR